MGIPGEFDNPQFTDVMKNIIETGDKLVGLKKLLKENY
jgi:hypothetical protein